MRTREPSATSSPPDQLTPDERFRELARLLAVGVRRLLSRTPEKVSDSSENSLEVSPETRLSVHDG